MDNELYVDTLLQVKSFYRYVNTSILWEIEMTRNIGSTERIIRAVAGLAILSLTVVGPQSMWGLLGLVPLATAAVGWCPPYSLLGINTCKTR
jgi:cadmium resistance protein CadD (predicted permease)